ncbi:methyl-accepting chemotaxis protein [Rhodopseudomonas sp. WA056]|uniref:Methyl-accepting chemotaxis sensory transducer n=3 Tax=Rhodopseudomonas palustris TaxID=1076 RepID=E6VEV8_RHOPX|nr:MULTISPECIES: methyl-accepting chemotaxis protein [Rhodopseudomonas]NEW87064.1 methyl-accepting chemotaxis protein [Rhodopseudomonas sp. WA056]QDL99135.1 methyl-accepting chemotaxis protein [Rhodopseudomonas palustris]
MLSSLSIRTKIIALVALLLVATAGIGGLGLLKMRTLNNSTVDIATNWLPSVRVLGDIRTTMAMYRVTLRAHAMEVTAEGKATAAKRIAGVEEVLNKQIASYQKMITSPEEKALYDQLDKELKVYLDGAKKAVEMSQQSLGQSTAELGVYLTKTLGPIGGRVDAVLQKSVDLNNKGSDQSTAAAEAAYSSATMIVVGILALAVAFGVVASYLVIRDISRGIASIISPMQALGRGDLAAEVPHRGESTEIGAMADALQIFKEALIAKRDADAAAAREAEEKIARGQRVDAATRQFERAIGEIVETVSSASTELEASAGTLTSTADRSQQLATSVAAASEEASTNVQSVASATEEMSSSITEISRQVQESSRIASEAVEQARKTNDSVGDLSEAASRIGDVVELINTIAGQTNLLALNATIEAARAGEAGRGFAVVAAEVKALAEQTAKATGEISQHITGIQSATNESVDAIREIGLTIGRMSEISSAIAAAVEEQGAATREISRNVQMAARGTQEVSSNVTDVQRGATETGSASSQVLSAAQSLSQESSRLKIEVANFLDTVRAA